MDRQTAGQVIAIALRFAIKRGTDKKQKTTHPPQKIELENQTKFGKPEKIQKTKIAVTGVSNKCWKLEKKSAANKKFWEAHPNLLADQKILLRKQEK